MQQQQETYVFLADSSKRDRIMHPESNEYALQFQIPFQNVCSFSLLDATIPSTHYLVDEGSNTLTYTLEDDPEVFVLTVTPGNYTMTQLLDALNLQLFGGVTVDPVSTPVELSNRVRFGRPWGRFVLRMDKSGLRKALGFGPAAYEVGTVVGADVSWSPSSPASTRLNATRSIRQRFVASTTGVLYRLQLTTTDAVPASPYTILRARVGGAVATVNGWTTGTTAFVFAFDPTQRFVVQEGTEYVVTYEWMSGPDFLASLLTDLRGSGTSAPGPAEITVDAGTSWTPIPGLVVPTLVTLDRTSALVSTCFQGPFREQQTALLTQGGVRVRQPFVCTSAGALSGATVFCRETAVPGTVLGVRVLDATGATTLAQGTVTPLRGPVSTLALAPRGTVTAGQICLLEVWLLSGAGTHEVFVASGVAGTTELMQVSSDDGVTWTSTTLQLCCQVDTSVQTYQISSPNMIDLTGIRTVLIRCPEIERMLFRERFTDDEIHAGLGYVKMNGTGFREQRNDFFIPFPPRTFHPVSKVSSLTIRLEQPDGTLYPTRGVDHYLLLAITYSKYN